MTAKTRMELRNYFIWKQWKNKPQVLLPDTNHNSSQEKADIVKCWQEGWTDELSLTAGKGGHSGKPLGIIPKAPHVTHPFYSEACDKQMWPLKFSESHFPGW
jgi:hypothetical protein